MDFERIEQGRRFAQLDQEWGLIQERIKRDRYDPREFRRAVRWVLVNVFGTEGQFQFDAMFHTKVCTAEQMIFRAAELRPTEED